MGLCVTAGRCGKEQNHVTQWQTSLGFRFFLYVVPNQTVSSEGQRLPLFFYKDEDKSEYVLIERKVTVL